MEVDHPSQPSRTTEEHGEDEAQGRKRPRADTIPEEKDAAVADEGSAIHTANQTAKTYVFKEEELMDLLIRFEHLLEQEHTAAHEQVSHEPALPVVRGALHEGKPLPASIHTAHQLKHPHLAWDHKGEPEWVAYEDDAGDIDEDTFLNADRDLTDAEIASNLARDI